MVDLGFPKLCQVNRNHSEAERVREIFTLYLQHRSLLKVVQELNVRSWTTKSWIRKDGKRRLGKPFTKTSLHNLLTKVIYLGKVKHQGKIYEGEHEAIIDESLWSQVQQLLRHNGRNDGYIQRNKHGALLKGLVRCAHCRTTMFHTFSQRGNRRYRYYVCSAAQKRGYANCPSRSVPAAELENFVVERIKEIRVDTMESICKKVQRELKTRRGPLTKEKDDLQRQLEKYQKQAKKIMTAIGEGEQTSQIINDHLAGIEEQVKRCRNRLAEINRELIIVTRTDIKKTDLKNALSLFDPIWEMLFPKEQTRIIQLLIERVDYDAVRETLAITFSPVGIRALSDEMESIQKKDKNAPTDK